MARQQDSCPSSSSRALLCCCSWFAFSGNLISSQRLGLPWQTKALTSKVYSAITRCPTDCVESDDVESTAGVASADLKPSLETLDRETPAKDFAQVKEEAKQRKPGDQPAWPESYYAW